MGAKPCRGPRNLVPDAAASLCGPGTRKEAETAAPAGLPTGASAGPRSCRTEALDSSPRVVVHPRRTDWKTRRPSDHSGRRRSTLAKPPPTVNQLGDGLVFYRALTSGESADALGMCERSHGCVGGAALYALNTVARTSELVPRPWTGPGRSYQTGLGATQPVRYVPNRRERWRTWRTRQTHRFQVPASASSSGFESLLSHSHDSMKRGARLTELRAAQALRNAANSRESGGPGRCTGFR